MRTLILAALLLTACGTQQSAQKDTSAADPCFGLAGTYKNGLQYVNIGRDGQFAYCKVTSSRCPDLWIHSMGSDGTAQIFSIQFSGPYTPPHPECQQAQGNSTLMLTVLAGNLTVQSSGGSYSYGVSP